MTTTLDQAPGGETGPASPCTGICSLNDDDICVGCGRTIDEIVGWASLTPVAKAAVNDKATERRLALGPDPLGT